MSSQGKRYSKEEKQEVVDFVTEYNDSHNGRGGVVKAVKKFGMTAVTIKGWLDISAAPNIVGLSTPKGSNIFNQLGELHEEIAKREVELEALKKQFELLKKKADI